MNKIINFDINEKNNIIISCGEKTLEVINCTITADQIYDLLSFDIGDEYTIEEIPTNIKSIEPVKEFRNLLIDITTKIKEIDISDSNNAETKDLI